jgi:hypothetical protein
MLACMIHLAADAAAATGLLAELDAMVGAFLFIR